MLGTCLDLRPGHGHGMDNFCSQSRITGGLMRFAMAGRAGQTLILEGNSMDGTNLAKNVMRGVEERGSVEGTDASAGGDSGAITRRQAIAGISAVIAGTGLPAVPALARQPRPQRFSTRQLVDSGHKFFGTISRGLAQVVEEASHRWGQPNAYILGQEASGAFIAGARYGEGMMYTRNAGDRRVYWQGPSIGFDAGADGARTMMLVYNLPSTRWIYRRFGGVDGSAYFIGGFGFTALTADRVVVVPIRSGIGARLGINLGYLKFTPRSTWNPF